MNGRGKPHIGVDSVYHMEVDPDSAKFKGRTEPSAARAAGRSSDENPEQYATTIPPLGGDGPRGDMLSSVVFSFGGKMR